MEFDWTGVVDYSKRATIQVPKTQYELPGVTEEDHQGVSGRGGAVMARGRDREDHARTW